MARSTQPAARLDGRLAVPGARGASSALDNPERIVVKPRPRNYARQVGMQAAAGASGGASATVDSPERPPAVGTTRETLPDYLLGGVRSMDGVVHRRGARPLNLRELDWYNTDPYALLDILPDFSADASRATWNMTRLGNSGYTLLAKNGKTKEVDPVATALIRKWAARACRGVVSTIPGAMGGFRPFLNTLFRQAYLCGAICAEAVLTGDRDDVYDIVPVSPTSIEFRTDDRNPGMHRFTQRQAAFPRGYRELNPNTFTYYAIDDQLYGRVPIAAAIQTIPFALRFWAELQVWVHGQAWPFLDGEVSVEALEKIWPKIPNETKKKYNQNFMQWALEAVHQIGAKFDKKRVKDPDAVIPHLDLLKLNLKSGGTGFAVKEVSDAIKREVVNSLQMMPALMGFNEGTTETHSSVQVQVASSAVQEFQCGVAHVACRSLYVGLQAVGYPEDVEVVLTFQRMATLDRLREAQSQRLEDEALYRRQDRGLIDQTTVAERLEGTPPTLPEPPEWAEKAAAMQDPSDQGAKGGRPNGSTNASNGKSDNAD